MNDDRKNRMVQAAKQVQRKINIDVWKEGVWAGVTIGAVLVGLAWGAVSGYNIYRAREDYRSETGLMVVEVRRQDGTIAPFYTRTGEAINDLRVPLVSGETSFTPGTVSACIDLAWRRDERVRQSRLAQRQREQALGVQ